VEGLDSRKRLYRSDEVGAIVFAFGFGSMKLVSKANLRSSASESARPENYGGVDSPLYRTATRFHFRASIGRNAVPPERALPQRKQAGRVLKKNQGFRA